MIKRTSVPADAKMSRRQEIIETATELFAAQTYHSVGMRAIAKAVGIQSSSLYHHFQSKDDLLAAITSEYTHSFIEIHLPILEGEDTPAERVRAVLRDQIVYFWVHRLKRMVGLRELSTLARVKPDAYNQVRNDLRRYQHAIDNAIAEGVKSKTFKVDDPKMAGLAITGLVTSINDWYDPEGKRTIEEVAVYFSDIAVDRLLLAKK